MNHDEIVLAFDETERRVLAGIISCSAERRSKNVSSGCAEWTDEVSESVVFPWLAIAADVWEVGNWIYEEAGLWYRTRVRVPVLVVNGTFLLAHKLLVGDFCELNHFDEFLLL